MLNVSANNVCFNVSHLCFVNSVSSSKLCFRFTFTWINLIKIILKQAKGRRRTNLRTLNMKTKAKIQMLNNFILFQLQKSQKTIK